jgi:hypothetical protein
MRVFILVSIDDATRYIAKLAVEKMIFIDFGILERFIRSEIIFYAACW